MNTASVRLAILGCTTCGLFRLAPIVLIMCGLLAGCGTKDHSAQTTADVQPGDTHLSQGKAISIAEKVAVKAGFKLSDYKPRTASVDVEYGTKKRFLTW